MSKFVRQSKYRHVFGTPAKDTFQELRITKNAWDSNTVAANPYYVAVNWETGGGGFALFTHQGTGKVGNNAPLFTGHKGAVLDTAFNPFNDSIIASCSEDTTINIWGIPAGGPKENVTSPLLTLKGHGRKVGKVLWHPSANNVLASASTDLTIRLWDVENSTEKARVKGHSDMILDFDWDYNGSRCVSVGKDKKIKLWDPRSPDEIGSGDSHPGMKGSRVCWLGRKELIFTFGFSKMSERQYSVWDPKDLSKPLVSENIDNSSGVIMPFYDEDSNVLFLAGKGDGNIRLYEVVDEAPYVFYLNDHKSSTPQRGMGALPKRAVNAASAEIMRLYKLTNKELEPIAFEVPRKGEQFQEDLFPDCKAGTPAQTCEEYFAGGNAMPNTIGLEQGFVAVEASFNGVQSEAPVDSGNGCAECAKKDAEIARLKAELAAK